MKLVLYQPDIPQNTGSMLRLAACFGVEVAIIEPCGFVYDEARMKRAGMDYIDQLAITRHASWHSYCAGAQTGRLVLLTTKGSIALQNYAFQPEDRLLMGRESAGVPEEVSESADARVFIPIAASARSLNVAQAAAIALFEASRQVGFTQFA